LFMRSEKYGARIRKLYDAAIKAKTERYESLSEKAMPFGSALLAVPGLPAALIRLGRKSAESPQD
jgi:hypothetical protein